MAGYGDDAGFATWLTENGYNLPDGAPSAEVLRNRGSAYIDATYGSRFSGMPTAGLAQERAWPRTGAYAYGQAIGDDVIPDAVVKASYIAAWQEASAAGSLSVAGSEATAVKREKVEGAVEVEYQANSAPWTAESLRVVLTDVEGLLQPFLTSAAACPAVLVV